MARRKTPVQLKFDIADLLGKTPAKIQTELLECKDFEVGIVTGFAAGKTRGICAAALIHAVRYPGAKVALGRKTYKETIDTVKQPFFVMASPLWDAGWFVKPDRWDYREGTHVLRLVNGSQIQFVNMSDPVKFRNEEFSLVIVDQAEEISEELFEILTGRVRWPLVPAEGRQIIAAANDNGHNWVWHRFVNRPKEHEANALRCPTPRCRFLAGHPDEEGNPRPELPCVTLRFFHGTTLDNKQNLAPQYLSILLSRPKAWQDQFVWATMESQTGRLLPTLTEIDHFDPPQSWPRWFGMDHALSSPACGIWVTVNVSERVVNGVPPQAVYVYREYYQGDRSVDQHARAVLALSKGERFLGKTLDRSAWRMDQSRKNGGRCSVADLYADEGLYMDASMGDPWARVERIKMAHNKGMVVSRACVNLIRTAPEYHADLTNVEGVYKIVNKSAFHAVDALGYALMPIPLQNESEPFLSLGMSLAIGSLEAVHARHEKARVESVAAEVATSGAVEIQGLLPGSPLKDYRAATHEFLGESYVDSYNPYDGDEDDSWV